ncbi:hypothetical protein FCM35_KLT02537 [Carex littledalei]|uniref:Uncharacterized protein n=1 Tax=Carex littledalei TaxID=544730 RepID=A0A833QSX7_9POAL|nr:hypothetical protein FCM35_KLT02537 [Carex littledalei]
MKRGGIKKMLAESEFKAAHEAAIEIGAKVVPGDRPHRYKGIYDEDIELLNSFPPAYETLAEEHHMYMAHNLWKEVGQCSSLVALLERSHLNHIRKYWHIEFLVEAVIVTVKEHSSSVKFFSSVGAVIVTFIGIYLWRKN